MSSKHDVSSRYERDSRGILCIDVATEKAEDLYNNFDRDSPYIRRDLHQDLVDYLIECAEELYPQPFIIRFSFRTPLETGKLERIRNSISTYFEYLVSSEQQVLRKMAYRSGTYLMIGLAVLVSAFLMSRTPGNDDSVVSSVFGEGLIIAAWVSLWEAIAVFMVDWFPRRRKIRLYGILAKVELEFRNRGQGVSANESGVGSNLN